MQFRLLALVSRSLALACQINSAILVLGDWAEVLWCGYVPKLMYPGDQAKEAANLQFGLLTVGLVDLG